jgi:NADPH2:quinone reductase
MKAAVYYETGGPDVFRYEDVPDPACGPGSVLIDVKAISIEGGDTLHRPAVRSSRPHIVGYQCAGLVREVGAGVTDRTLTARWPSMNGSHAEQVAVPAMSTWVLPDGLDLGPGACVPIPFGTADDCLFEFGRLKAGEIALVHAGAGGVGIAAIQLAKRAGATVLATASRDDKLERLKGFGLDHGINYRSGDFVEAVRELTGGHGADVIVDSVGGRTLAGSIDARIAGGSHTWARQVAMRRRRASARLRPATRPSVASFGAELMLSHQRVHDDRGSSGRHRTQRAHVVDRRYPLAGRRQALRRAARTSTRAARAVSDHGVTAFTNSTGMFEERDGSLIVSACTTRKPAFPSRSRS